MTDAFFTPQAPPSEPAEFWGTDGAIDGRIFSSPEAEELCEMELYRVDLEKVGFAFSYLLSNKPAQNRPDMIREAIYRDAIVQFSACLDPRFFLGRNIACSSDLSRQGRTMLIEIRDGFVAHRHGHLRRCIAVTNEERDLALHSRVHSEGDAEILIALVALLNDAQSYIGLRSQRLTYLVAEQLRELTTEEYQKLAIAELAPCRVGHAKSARRSYRHSG